MIEIHAEVPLTECLWLWDPFQDDGLKPIDLSWCLSAPHS